MRTFILLFVTTFFLSACGQKGPLYLPDDPRYAKEAKKHEKYRKREQENKDKKK